MAEWGIPFDYIETHWTTRQLHMHAARLAERRDRETPKPARGSRSGNSGRSSGRSMKYKDYLRDHMGIT